VTSGGALQPSNPGHPSQQELDNADQDTNWITMNKGYSGTRYSSLDQINTSNAANLKATCAIQLGDPGSFESTPQEYDGVIYITTPHNTYAINATNCNKLWEYDYKPTGPQADPTDRGLALYNGMVFRGTTDAHVIALDMRTGKLLWNIQPVDPAKGYFLSSAPIVYKGLVLIGTAGADWGANGKMFAFDAATGKQVWSFSEIVPSTFGTKQGAATGGGSNWSSYSLDPNTGLVYVPVGNPAPDFLPKYRPGKNLYTDSVVVLDATTGKLVHYYQQIPNDAFDWDTQATPPLFKINGTLYLGVTNKAGYLYVYNTSTHKQVFKVPVTTINDNASKVPTKEGLYTCPGNVGGVEWNGASYSPKLKMLFVNSNDWCSTIYSGSPRYIQGQIFLGGKIGFGPVSKASGWTHAVDAKTGDIVWKRKSKTAMVASVTPTAGGLLFTGDLNNHFLALNATTGQTLYSFNTGGAIGGGISTYAVNGKQYVAVATGDNASLYNGRSAGTPTVFVFSLR
jgi:PQQ-dependent dehydrogenase (methanol/ethanol family)